MPIVGCDKMEEVMDQISKKKKMRILFMVNGTLRYGELRRLLGSVTPRCSQTSWSWPPMGWWEPHRLWRGPAQVDYRLTPERRGIDAYF